jgi:predicted membrane protein
MHKGGAMEKRYDDRHFKFSSHLFFGLLVIALGVLFLLGNLGFVNAHHVWLYWPVLLVIFGLVKLASAREVPSRVLGFLLAVFGALLLGHNFGYFYFSIWDFWPLLLVWVGFNIVWQSLYNKRSARDKTGDKSNTVSGIGILGGVNQSCHSRDFRGGDLTAFMGGGEVDLRKSDMESGEAVIAVNAFMGGFKIFVPEDWTVICKVVPFMGGVEDKTAHPQSGSEKNLVLKGFVCMGGLEIRN